jgi:hypothetical protein
MNPSASSKNQNAPRSPFKLPKREEMANPLRLADEARELGIRARSVETGTRLSKS